jgi:hypothetical protein
VEHNGPINVFDLGNNDLLIRRVKPPGKAVITRILQQLLAGQQSAKEAKNVVNICSIFVTSVAGGQIKKFRAGSTVNGLNSQITPFSP